MLSFGRHWRITNSRTNPPARSPLSNATGLAGVKPVFKSPREAQFSFSSGWLGVAFASAGVSSLFASVSFAPADGFCCGWAATEMESRASENRQRLKTRMRSPVVLGGFEFCFRIKFRSKERVRKNNQLLKRASL